MKVDERALPSTLSGKIVAIFEPIIEPQSPPRKQNECDKRYVSGLGKFTCNCTLHVELVKADSNHEIAEYNGGLQRSQALFVGAFTKAIAGQAGGDYFESNSVLRRRQQGNDVVELSYRTWPAMLWTKALLQANLIRSPFNSPEESFYKL